MIVHLINTFEPRNGSDLVRALPVTVASMQRAASDARNAGLSVQLRAAAFEHEQHTVPSEFVATRPLTRTCRDIPGLSNFPPLPFYRDLLERLADETDETDLLIYSNSDIALQPNFYIEVSRIAESGLKSFTINRRTIGDHYKGSEDLEAMYRDQGQPHPGSDCFVFRAGCLKTFQLVDVVVGTAMFDKMLLWNLLVFGQPFQVVADRCLTFHMGNDMSWKDERTRPLRMHNRESLFSMLVEIRESRGPLLSLSPLCKPLLAKANGKRGPTTIYELLGFRFSLRDRLRRIGLKFKSCLWRGRHSNSCTHILKENVR